MNLRIVLINGKQSSDLYIINFYYFINFLTLLYNFLTYKYTVIIFKSLRMKKIICLSIMIFLIFSCAKHIKD